MYHINVQLFFVNYKCVLLDIATSRFNFLKNKAVEVVKGLEYLHSRGWVHFDLSLDTLAVS